MGILVSQRDRLARVAMCSKLERKCGCAELEPPCLHPSTVLAMMILNDIYNPSALDHLRCSVVCAAYAICALDFEPSSTGIGDPLGKASRPAARMCASSLQTYKYIRTSDLCASSLSSRCPRCVSNPRRACAMRRLARDCPCEGGRPGRDQVATRWSSRRYTGSNFMC